MTAPAGIIWLASFPKSGNTWFRIFLANLAAGENGPADINNLDERGDRQQPPHSKCEFSELISHDDIDRLRPRVYKRISAEATEQCWIKVHDAYTLAAPMATPHAGSGVDARRRLPGPPPARRCHIARQAEHDDR